MQRRLTASTCSLPGRYQRRVTCCMATALPRRPQSYRAAPSGMLALATLPAACPAGGRCGKRPAGCGLALAEIPPAGTRNGGRPEPASGPCLSICDCRENCHCVNDPQPYNAHSGVVGVLCRHHNIEGFGFPDRRQIPSMCQEAPGKRQEVAEKPKGADDLLTIVRERYAISRMTVGMD